MRKGKLKVGDIVHIRFLDHTYGPGTQPGVARCEAFGKVIHEDIDEIQLVTWLSDGDAQDEHSNITSIIRRSITACLRLSVSEEVS